MGIIVEWIHPAHSATTAGGEEGFLSINSEDTASFACSELIRMNGETKKRAPSTMWF